jgi:hypothetical protein
MPTATLPGVTTSHAYENDLITEAHSVQRGFMKVPEGVGLGVELDEDMVKRYSHLSAPGSVTTYLCRHTTWRYQTLLPKPAAG